MQKKKAILLLTTMMSIGAISTTVLLSNSGSFSVNTNADVEPYTLTIDASNKSNFVQDGDVYRGTFKTGLGNDVSFITNKVETNPNYLFSWRIGNGYLKNVDALTGLTKVEISGFVYPSGNIHCGVELRLGYNQTSPMFTNIDFFSGNEVTTKTFELSTINVGNFVTCKISESGTNPNILRVTAVKFYFSCSNTKSFAKVSPSTEGYGTVSFVGRSGKELTLSGGEELTIHAEDRWDYEEGVYTTFKGWYLNGGETPVTLENDYTFTVEQNKQYDFVARFDHAEFDSYTIAEMHTIGEVVPTDDLYSSYLTASRGGLEYCLKADIYGLSGYKTQQAFTEGKVFQLEFESGYGGSDRRKQELTLSGFDPNYVSCVELIVDMSNSSYTDQMVKYSGSGTFTSYQHEDDYTKIVWSGMTSDTAVLHPTNDLYNSNAGLSFIVKQVNVIYK